MQSHEVALARFFVSGHTASQGTGMMLTLISPVISSPYHQLGRVRGTVSSQTYPFASTSHTW
jgi:mRNA degradation ribonuclease J1/J2